MEQPQLDIKELLEKNIALSEQILYHTKKTHRHLMWDSAFSAIKWVIILAPLLAAAWYFPKYTKDIVGFTTDIGKQFEFMQKQIGQLGDLQKQAEQMQKQIPKRK